MRYISVIFFCLAPFTVAWKTFQNSELLIKYPDNWELNLSGASGTKFILFAPSAQSATFRDNINLIVEDLKGQKIGLEEYTKLSIAQVKQYISNATILVSEAIKSLCIQVAKESLIFNFNNTIGSKMERLTY